MIKVYAHASGQYGSAAASVLNYLLQERIKNGSLIMLLELYTLLEMIFRQRLRLLVIPFILVVPYILVLKVLPFLVLVQHLPH